MPLQIQLRDTSVPQAWILQDATPYNDGVMTATQAAQLAALVAGGGGGGGGAAHSGIAVFAVGGAGAGFDYVDIVFAAPMTADYVINMSVGKALGSVVETSLPKVDYYQKTLAGFRMIPQAAFDGEASWAVFAKTQ